MLTRSPATIPWPTAPRVTAASPVRTPARDLEAVARRSPRRTDRLDQLERGADRALGVILVRDRRAPHGHDRVTDELLDRPAVAPDDLARDLEVPGQQVADRLRVAVLGQRREADEVGEQDRSPAAARRCAASATGSAPMAAELGVTGSAPPMAAPHSPQNRSVGALAVPQAGHVARGECRTTRRTCGLVRWPSHTPDSPMRHLVPYGL